MKFYYKMSENDMDRRRLSNGEIGMVSKFQKPMAASKIMIFKQARLLYGCRSTNSFEGKDEETPEKVLKKDRSLKSLGIKISENRVKNRVGPGCYNSFSPIHPTSQSFSLLSRFPENNIEEKFRLRKGKSPECDMKSIKQRVKINKNMSQCSFAIKKQNILQKAKEKTNSIKIAQNIKSQIYSAKILKKQEIIEIKNEKSEKHLKKMQNAANVQRRKSWKIILCAYSGIHILILCLLKEKAIRLKSFKTLCVLHYVFKLIGKFIITLKRFRKVQIFKLLAICFKPYLINGLQEVKSKYIAPISEILLFYTKGFELKCILKAWRTRIKVIEDFILIYSEIKKARIKSLCLLWDKLRPNQPISVQSKSKMIKNYLFIRISQYRRACIDYKSAFASSDKVKKKEMQVRYKTQKPLLTIYSNSVEFVAFISQQSKSSLTKKRKIIEKKKSKPKFHKSKHGPPLVLKDTHNR